MGRDDFLLDAVLVTLENLSPKLGGHLAIHVWLRPAETTISRFHPHLRYLFIV
jgi:hypothetical protein